MDDLEVAMRTYFSVFLGFLLACGSAAPTPAETPSIDDGPTITNGPKLQVIVGVEGGSLGTGSIDGAPGIADFRRITGLFRGPYDGPGAYDGREEIETALVIDADAREPLPNDGSSGRPALRVVLEDGTVRTLLRDVPKWNAIFAADHAAIVATPTATDGTELQRIGLDGSQSTLGTVPFRVVAGAFDGSGFVLVSQTTLYRWKPGTEPIVLFADVTQIRSGPTPLAFLGAAVDRANGDVYVHVLANEVEGGNIRFAGKLEGNTIAPLEGLGGEDFRVVAGKVRTRGYFQAASPNQRMPRPRGRATTQTLDRGRDTLGVSDFRIVRFTKPDRSDETLFAGREFNQSDLPLDGCRLSESPRRTPAAACDDGRKAVRIFEKSIGATEPDTRDIAWTDISDSGVIQTLHRDGTYSEDGKTIFRSRGGEPLVGGSHTADGTLWATDGIALYRAKPGGTLLKELGYFGGASSLTALDNVVYFTAGGTLHTFKVVIDDHKEFTEEMGNEAEVHVVRRFNNSLYVATLSTIERVDLRTHETTVVLGTLGKHAFVSDGSGLPFIDDFTFDHQGGIVIYSAATRSIYYARP